MGSIWAKQKDGGIQPANFKAPAYYCHIMSKIMVAQMYILCYHGTAVAESVEVPMGIPLAGSFGESRPMLASGLVAEVRRLLEEGRLSQRNIARSMGVSRGTVNAIARGIRPDYETRRRELPSDLVSPSGPLRRCPGCGGLVQMPCLLCHVRAMKRGVTRSECY